MDPEAIEKFMEVTGESEFIASQYLTLTKGNVQNAILLMFERIGPDGKDALKMEEPEVRAPILPTQEVLVPSEPICSLPRTSNNVFDRFRDFSVETRRQEEEMTRQVSGGVINPALNKTKRLEDLFRPPYDILFTGSFSEARDHAKSINRWLLVNVQNSQEFSCQVLNRDVWSDKQIKEIIKDHFVLWQVLSDSSDGGRYIDFYNVIEYPYLAVVDPRTGECMRSYNHITVDLLLTGLNDILSSQPSPDSSADSPNVEESHCEPSSSIQSGAYLDPKEFGSHSRNGNSFGINTNTGSSHTIRGKRSRIEIPEELGDSPSNEAAMPTKEDSVAHSSNTEPEHSMKTEPEHSLKTEPEHSLSIEPEHSSNTELEHSLKIEPDHSPNTEPEYSLNTEPGQSSNTEQENSSNKSEIPDGKPSLKLCLRLPNGGKEAVSMCAHDTIEAFIKRMEEMGFLRSEHTYLIPFPKTNVGALPSDTRLCDTILYPSNTVFITKV